MRILLLNPNTSPEITDLVLASARRVAAPGTILNAATGRFGARYIASRAAAAIAEHATLDAYATYGADADVIALACFGDPGLLALRELATQPVVGMAEAACQEAATGGRRFAIVTGGERWGPMLEEFVATLGLQDQLAIVKTVAPTGAAIASDPDTSLGLLADACNTCIAKHGAEAVILGGAGLAGIAERIAARVDGLLIDSVSAIVTAAERLGRDRPQKPDTGTFARTPAVPTIGLSSELSGLLHAG